MPPVSGSPYSQSRAHIVYAGAYAALLDHDLAGPLLRYGITERYVVEADEVAFEQTARTGCVFRSLSLPSAILLRAVLGCPELAHILVVAVGHLVLSVDVIEILVVERFVTHVRVQ